MSAWLPFIFTAEARSRRALIKKISASPRLRGEITGFLPKTVEKRRSKMPYKRRFLVGWYVGMVKKSSGALQKGLCECKRVLFSMRFSFSLIRVYSSSFVVKNGGSA
jgi:hypothetical protein